MYNEGTLGSNGQGDPGDAPNEECPNCHQKVEDWHVEWYKTEGPMLFRGLAAMDCPALYVGNQSDFNKERSG